MQSAADPAWRSWTKNPGVAANVTSSSSTFAGDLKDLLHVSASDVSRWYMQPELSELLSRFKQIHSDRTKIRRSAFHDDGPTWTNPYLHA